VEPRKIKIIQPERAMARARARSSAHAAKSMTSPMPAVTWRGQDTQGRGAFLRAVTGRSRHRKTDN